MKPGALHLLIATVLVLAAIPAVLAGPIHLTALFHDDFADTSQLDSIDTLVTQEGYLQVPEEVTWHQDTRADFVPGTGLGVDLAAEPGSVVLARFSPDHRVNDAPAGLQGEVDAAHFQPTGKAPAPFYLYAVWVDGRGGDLDIYFARSTDAGLTWSAGCKLNPLDDAGDQHAPAIAADGAYVHVAWEDGAGVHYARSQDYGATWVDDILLAAGAAPDIAAAVVNDVSLVYLLYVAEEIPGDPDLYALRSANGGASWGTPENVVAGEPDGAVQRAPSLFLPAGFDVPWAAWEDDRDGGWNIYSGQRGGSSWSTLRVDDGPAGSAQHDPVLFHPAGAIAPHAIWADDRAGGSDLYEAYYDIGTQAWVESGPLTSGAGAGAPAVGALPSHTWSSWPNGTYDTVQASPNDGAAWGAPLTVPDHRPGASYSAPAVTQADVDGSTVAVLWSDDRAGDGDVYVATSDGTYWATGVYTSPVHEFGDLAGWGPIAWTGVDLADVAVEARSGPTPLPGPEWSDWAAAGNGADFPAPGARYAQYRAHLARPPLGTPALDSVTITAYPHRGSATSVPAGHCVAAWGEFSSEGYAPAGTTLTLSVLDLTGTVLYSDVVTPFALSGVPAAQYGRLRLYAAMERSPAETPRLDWWQVSWEEGHTHAAFSYEPPIVYTPTIVAFTNLSTATVTPLRYVWEFGDGGTTTAEQPTHTYALAGTYTATLRAAGECGVDVAAATLAVLPLPLVSPTAAFSHGPLCTGEPVTFTNQSTAAIWWQWAFGDGTGSAAFQPTHTYSASGDYTLTLAVTNTLGSDLALGALPVRPAPTAAFTWTVELLTVALTPAVSGDPALAWDFGDGFTSTLAQPVHTYAAPGAYTVTLTAQNACGQATAAAAVTVALPPVYRAYLPILTRAYYPGDAYEDDDTPEQARLLPLDTPQRRDFAPADDVDWAYLNLSDGVTYYFFTYDLAGGADTVLALYVPGQAEPLLENDDCTGQTLASCLTFTPLTTGRYELRVTNITGVWGAEVAYTLAGRMQ